VLTGSTARGGLLGHRIVTNRMALPRNGEPVKGPSESRTIMSGSVQAKARFGHTTRFVNLQGRAARSPSPTADTQIFLLQPDQRTNVRNCSATDDEEATWTAIRIPRGKSFLVVRTGVIHTRRRRPRAAPYVAVQPVRSGNSTALAVMDSGDTRICVHGIPAPRVELLWEKDELQVCGALQVAYVTSSSGPQLGHGVLPGNWSSWRGAGHQESRLTPAAAALVESCVR
jgi:hypothetical protein